MDEGESYGRFLEPALLILISLADGPKHGYAMMEEIERLAAVRLGPGTLYGALTRLERSGWITPLPAHDRRQPYQLTERGQHILRIHLDRLTSLTVSTLQRLGSL